MTETLFRAEAVEARRQRLVGTVVAALPPSSRLYTLLLSAVALVLALFLLFGSYAGSAGVRGIVAYDAGVARVFAPSPGAVRQVMVQPGQQVTEGAPLVALSLAQGARGLGTQLAELDRQIAEIDSQLRIAAASSNDGLASLGQQQHALAETVTSLERQRVIVGSQIGLADNAVARSGRLAKQGAGSQRQTEDARRDALTRRAEAEALGERLITTRASLAAIAIQLSQTRLEAARLRSQLVAQRAALTAQRADLERADHLVLAAPTAGEVGDVAAEIGQRATTDQALVSIVPRGSRMEVWLYAPSAAVGFAVPGQKVRLRFDAFPSQKYGWGNGTVTAVSRVATDPAGVDAAVRPTEPVFRVRVHIDSLPAIASDHGAAIRQGMTVSADLVQRRRPLWALVLGPVAGGAGG